MADLDLFDPNAAQPQQGGIGADLQAGLHRAAAGLGMAGASLGLPTQGWAQGQAQTAQNYQGIASAGGIPQTFKEVQGPVDMLKFVGGQAAQMAPQLGAMAAGGLAGGPVGAGAAAYPLIYGENLQSQYEDTGKTNPGMAAGLAVPETALNMVSPEGRAARMALGAVDRTGSRIANAALTAGREAGVNAGIGATTAVLNEVNKSSVTNQPVDLLSATQNVVEGAATGAVMGGIIGAGRGVLHTPIPRAPDDAGGDSSRDAAYGSPSAGNGGNVSTTLALGDKNIDKIPAYQRQGKVIPGVNDTATGGDDIGAAMTGQAPQDQLSLDLGGAGPYSPRFDAKGNPLPGQFTPNAGANAGAVGAGPYNTHDQAVQGLQMMHRDLTAQLKQAVDAGDSNAVQALTEQIKGVEGHLATLDSAPDTSGQPELPQVNRAARTGSAGAGVLLFGDKDAETQIDEAQKIATSSQPEATPNPNAQIELPQGVQKPGFQLQGHPTPQFDDATKVAPESQQRMQAQVDAVRDPSSAKDTALFTPNSDTTGVNTEGLESVPTKQGTVVTSNPEKANFARANADNLTSEHVGKMLGYLESKATTDGTMVQALDKNGHVIHEEMTNAKNLDAARANAEKMMPDGGSVRVVPADQALRERAEEIQPELPGMRKPGENPEHPSNQAMPTQEPFSNPAMQDQMLKVLRQRDWDKAQEVIGNRRAGEMEAARAEKPDNEWPTRLRMAWKNGSEGSLQGFHKAMGKVLEAKSAEDAARLIRQKSEEGSNTPSHKLELMHRALTGESIEEGATREATERGKSASDTSEPSGDATLAPIPEEARALGAGDQEGTGHAAASDAGVPKEAGNVAGDNAGNGHDQNVRRLIQTLEGTKDPDEFQRAVNDLYRESQDGPERSGSKAAHTADLYLNDPESGITDENLAKAKEAFNEEGLTKTEKFTESEASKKRRSDMIDNPDRGNRTMLPEEMRRPGAEHTGHDMATWLSQNAKSQVVRMAMRTILNSGRDMHEVPIHIVHDGEMVPQFVAHEMTTGAEAFTTTGKKPEIWAHGNAADEETMAHELLHAALPEAMNRSNDGGMTSVMQDVKRAMQEAGMFETPEGKFFLAHALQNANEFTSYGFSSPTFRRMLDSLDNPAKPKLWDRFKAAVAAIFKAPKAFLDKLLDRQADAPHTPFAARMEESLHNMLSPDNPRVVDERINHYRQTAVSMKGGSEALGEAAHDVWDSLRSLARGANKVVMSSMPTHAISEAFSYRIPALKDVVKALDDRTTSQHVMARKAAVVHDAIQKAFKAADKSLGRFNEVMEDTQIAMMDPRKGDAFDRVQANLGRAKDTLDQVTAKEGATTLEKAAARAGMRIAQSAARLEDNWKKMSPEEKDAVGKAFDALKESQARRQAALRDILLKSRDGFHDEKLEMMRANGASDQEIDDQIVRTYGTVLHTGPEPYAPLRRYGDWVTTASSPEYRQAEADLRAARVKQAEEVSRDGEVSAKTQDDVRYQESLLRALTKDPEHRIVQFHDSSVAASNRAGELRSQMPHMQVQRFARADYMQHAGSISGGMMEKIISAVGEQLPPEIRDNIGAIMREIFVDSQPDNSFEHSMQGRQGVAGYSTDFGRATLDTLLRDSFNTSTLENSEQMGAAMRDLDEQRKASDDDTANNIYKSLAKRIAFQTDHQNFRKWEQRVSEVTHFMYLGFSPGFMLMNAMQMPMITAPMLYSRFGLHANGAIAKAIPDIWKAIKAGNLDLEHNAQHIPQQERDMLNQLQNLGILNMTTLHDMANTARASNIIDPQTTGEAFAKGWEISKDMANLPAQYIETVNRAASALAAYRLAREGRSAFGSMEHGAAMDYAAKIVRDSHVDYSAPNNAAWLRAPGGRFLFQFKKYWLNMLSMVGLNMWDAFGHGKEVKGLRNDLANEGLAQDVKDQKTQLLNQLLERRAVARRTISGLYAMHMLITGAQGMPFAGGAMALSNVLRNWYNDPEDHADTATDVQNYLASAFGVNPADTIMHGIMGGIFGMGVSNRIGMGDLQSPIHMTNNRAGANLKDTYDQVLLGALGPTVGLGEQIIQAMDLMAKGQYARGVEKMLPKAAGDVLKATRYVNDGGVQTPAGKMVTPTNGWDNFKTAIGVTPERVENAYQAQQATADEKSAFTGTRKSLIQNYAQALKMGGDTQEARQAVDAFNERNPDPNLRINLGEVYAAKNKIGAPAKPTSAKTKAVTARTDRGAFAQDD